ncbi:MFS general substrate transporter [Lepidopterella palustris CBS 459.81]|uniref:MFS general substrate transporter n=1 Tax=Lepidopterella palustris CBS 459.81 TaxID=1314670 RepID=A0A8E2DYW7_9PEZI|nr:MFS general substrate transporter [Lepidopterella palustris CBS 459.81]
MLLPCHSISRSSEREDLSAYEARVEFSEVTLNNDPSPSPVETLPGEKDHHAEKKLILSDRETICRARAFPDDTTPILLIFSQHDIDNPRNWSRARKWYITCFVSMLNVLTCLCAGGYSSGAPEISSEFHVSSEVATLGLSMYILGFAIGPLLLAPLSEHWGRNPIYIWSWLLLVLLQIPVALAPNMGTVIGCRFLQGFFGSSPLTNSGGTVSDLWVRDKSGSAMAVYGLSSTLGPPLALPITGFLAVYKGWRFLFWFFMAVLGAAWVLMVLTLPETRHTIILQRKTHRVRAQLAAEGLKAASNIIDATAAERKGWVKLFSVTLTRPIRFLLTEPITTSAAIYNGFIYGLIFLFNEAFPIVFSSPPHSFSPGLTSLTFLGLCVGSLFAFFLHPVQEHYYRQHCTPEARMWMALPGSFLLPIGLFMFGWTSSLSTPCGWLAPVVGSALFGAGVFIVILAVLNYVVDSYHAYSASALAGVILVRNLVGAGFPMFAAQMYGSLGPKWASSVLGFLGLILCGIPWWFFYCGVGIRRRSSWAMENRGE